MRQWLLRSGVWKLLARRRRLWRLDSSYSRSCYAGWAPSSSTRHMPFCVLAAFSHSARHFAHFDPVCAVVPILAAAPCLNFGASQRGIGRTSRGRSELHAGRRRNPRLSGAKRIRQEYDGEDGDWSARTDRRTNVFPTAAKFAKIWSGSNGASVTCPKSRICIHDRASRAGGGSYPAEGKLAENFLLRLPLPCCAGVSKA